MPVAVQPRAINVPASILDYCEPLQTVPEKELSEVELLIIIKGWINQYEVCSGKHKVLSQTVNGYNNYER
jgi:hypothetical protein